MPDLPPVRRAMRPFGELTSFDEARRTALDLCVPVTESESVPLSRAHGRVLAAPINSPVDVPLSDRAAMDGFAVVAADVAGAEAGAPALLEPAGRVLAGQLEEKAMASGECVEIATGGQLPRGADAVVPVEITTSRDGRIAVLEPVDPGAHIARRAEDLASGDRIADAGMSITPAIASALASVGIAGVEVLRRPRVLLAPTGDELVPIGDKLVAGQVYDSNSVGVQLLAEASGAHVERTEVVRDDPTRLMERLQQEGFDLLVTLGGTSVGRHDLVVDVVEEMGEALVHGIAIKPGKPVLLGRVDRTPIVGLPGFPTSCVLTAYLFVGPMVRALAGLSGDPHRRISAVLGEDVSSPPDKLQFLTVRVRDGVATPVFRASSTMTSMSAADGWIEIAVGTSGLTASSSVEVTLF